jgi:hypothetical protein
LLLGQALGEIVFGAFANCPLARDVGGGDPALKSSVFILEHPTGEQRKWQLQNANYEVTVREGFWWFGTGFCVGAFGDMGSRCAPEFGRTEDDARFICLDPIDEHGWASTQIISWELWSV